MWRCAYFGAFGAYLGVLSDEIAQYYSGLLFRNKNEVKLVNEQTFKLLSCRSLAKVSKIDCKLISTEAERVDYGIKLPAN